MEGAVDHGDGLAVLREQRKEALVVLEFAPAPRRVELGCDGCAALHDLALGIMESPPVRTVLGGVDGSAGVFLTLQFETCVPTKRKRKVSGSRSTSTR